jgi:L-ascorbate metabolism protein UlaG (beta-lactamase superfamily)
MKVKITWLGTASYILDIEGTRLLFDPFFYRNEQSTPVLKTKRENVKNISAIFLTHGHFDHAIDAGFFAETLDVPVYCSETAKDNIIRWAEGKIIEEPTFLLTDKGKKNIIPINFFEKIKISEEIIVESIKSEHVVFDIRTILSKLFSWKVLRKIRTLIRYGKGFPAGKVFGFCIFFNNKKIVSFGSLCPEFPDILKKYENCDIFLAPLAGNSKQHIAEKAGKMIDSLKPKIIIPIHWDDFFPPISWTVDLNPFFKYMEKSYPEKKIIMLDFDEETLIDLD